MANLINTLVKKLIAANEIVQNNSDGASSSQSGKSKLKKTVTVHNVFAHLDKFRQNCLTKDSHRAEALLSTESLQEVCLNCAHFLTNLLYFTCFLTLKSTKILPF